VSLESASGNRVGSTADKCDRKHEHNFMQYFVRLLCSGIVFIGLAKGPGNEATLTS